MRASSGSSSRTLANRSYYGRKSKRAIRDLYNLHVLMMRRSRGRSVGRSVERRIRDESIHDNGRGRA